MKIKKDDKKITLRFYNGYELALFPLIGIVPIASLLYWYSQGYVTPQNLFTNYFVYATAPIVFICLPFQALRESISVDLEKGTLSFCKFGFLEKTTIPLRNLSHISLDSVSPIWHNIQLSIVEKNSGKNELNSSKVQGGRFNHSIGYSLKDGRYTISRRYAGGSNNKAICESFVDDVNRIISERNS